MSTALKILLMYNADPYLADEQSYTPIHTAADNGHENIIEILINHDVDINLQTRLQGYTPLHLSVSRKRTNVIEFLLKTGNALFDNNVAFGFLI